VVLRRPLFSHRSIDLDSHDPSVRAMPYDPANWKTEPTSPLYSTLRAYTPRKLTVCNWGADRVTTGAHRPRSSPATRMSADSCNIRRRGRATREVAKPWAAPHSFCKPLGRINEAGSKGRRLAHGSRAKVPWQRMGLHQRATAHGALLRNHHLLLNKAWRHSFSYMLHRTPVDSMPFICRCVPLPIENVAKMPKAACTEDLSAHHATLRNHVGSLGFGVEAFVPSRPTRISEFGVCRVKRQAATGTCEIAYLRKGPHVSVRAR